jgi:arylsulfatase
LAGGFDHSYLLVDQDRFFSPANHSEDDVRLPQPAADSGYYATRAIADHALKCLREHAEKYADRPFFHYLCFTAPHFPLHGLTEDIAKYRGRFAGGWDALRVERHARMKKLGIIDCELSERTAGVPAWDSLSSAEMEEWQRHMEIHAAMIDRVDQEIGRVLAQLREMMALDNTVIFFLSDNGASAEKLVRGDGHDPNAPPGSAKTFMCLEPPWANLANVPLKRSKIFVHEGGISTSLIAHWPKGIAARGELRHNPGHVIDLTPTILEITGGKRLETYADEPVPPPPGKSLVPAFAKDGTVSHDYLWWFHSGNRAIRVGDYKLVSVGEDGSWELYDLKHDRSEIKDLASSQPDKVRALSAAWAARLEEFRVLASKDAPPPAPAKKKKAKAG